MVTWAYRCWIASGVLLGLLGVGYIVAGIFAAGPTLLPIGIGIIVIAVGVAYVLLGSKAYVGDARWRSSLAALTLVVVIMLVLLSFGDPALAFTLLAAVIGLFGSLLAYRPEADAWFNAGSPPECPEKSASAGKGKAGAKGRSSAGKNRPGGNTRPAEKRSGDKSAATARSKQDRKRDIA
ncbi:hypothetical protein [Gordonia otitidis]|uniref:Uncharacterized protein n=2 Tax=Gordonia otitidis TaxID=249058 RepID=H5TI28_GORO1|nr:hypothetical protein [Gordonia otitidis]UEA57771.1 hypothetical protein LK459_14245 [Gordonia otitidis]GAB33136.1 hypothetical protein GOOTI_046_00090 [Gordonia otitidis NBRC 100426]